MKGLTRLVCSLITILVVTGCVNPYTQFYRPNPGFEDARQLPSYDHDARGLSIFLTNNFDRDMPILVSNGYWPVGQSSFNAGAAAITETNLRAQASQVGAHAVLVSSNYSHTVQGALPVNLPTTSTTYSTGTATAYGSGGYATAYGSGVSTTYGSQTVMVPYSVARYDVGAVFFAKVKHRLGVVVVPLTDAERKQLGTNSALRVFAVVEGTPAFFADVLSGDYVLELAGKPAYSVPAFTQLVKEHEGQTVEVSLQRGDKRITKSVSIRRY